MDRNSPAPRLVLSASFVYDEFQTKTPVGNFYQVVDCCQWGLPSWAWALVGLGASSGACAVPGSVTDDGPFYVGREKRSTVVMGAANSAKRRIRSGQPKVRSGYVVKC